jgi:hypothetical protein
VVGQSNTELQGSAFISWPFCILGTCQVRVILSGEMADESKTLRDLAQTLLDTSERLKKEAVELNRRAQEIEAAVKKGKNGSQR